jgi:nucleolar protein 9
LDEVDGKEIALAADYGTSRIVEQILKLSTDFQLRVFFDRLRGSFPQLFMHQYASHVIQTMLGQCALRIGNESDDNSGQSDTPEGGELMSLKDLFLEMCAELDGYWPALMVDTYGSHLLRTVLFILSGRTLATDQIKSKSSRKFANNHQLIKAEGEQMPVPSTVKVSPEFTAHLTKIVTVIVNGVTDSQVRSMAVNLVARPVLQTLLQVISPTLADSLIDRLLMNITSGDLSGNESIDQQRRQYVQSMMQDQVGSHLFERMLQFMSAEMFSLVYQEFFSDRLLRFAQHPFANYVVQSVVSNANWRL